MLPTNPADIRRAILIARNIAASTQAQARASGGRLHRDAGGSVYIPGYGMVPIPSWVTPQQSTIPIQPGAIAPVRPMQAPAAAAAIGSASTAPAPGNASPDSSVSSAPSTV